MGSTTAKLFALLVIFLAALGALTLTERPRPRADLTIINRGDVTTLDLGKMSWRQDFRIARLLYEGLTERDIFSNDYTIQPAAAESWTVSPDGTEYVFTIRNTAKWSDGSPVLASDFAYAWRRILLPDNASDYWRLYAPIEGAETFYKFREAQIKQFPITTKDFTDEQRIAHAKELYEEALALFKSTVAIQPLDSHTLRVKLLRPVPYFTDILALGTSYPVCEAVATKAERINTATGLIEIDPAWTTPGRIVTNGPFILESWRFKRDMRLVANPHYWDRDSLAIHSIDIPSIADPNAQVLAFTSGSVDWLSDVSPGYRGDMLNDKYAFYKEHQAAYDELKAKGLDPISIDRLLPPDPRNRIHAFPAFGTYFYNFNCLPELPDGRKNPFANPLVRRAFAMAVDKQAIVRDIRRINERPIGSLTPPDTLPGYTPPTGVPYDPAAARELLAQAGYPGAKGLPTIEILFNKEGGHDLIAQVVAKNWQENLGVNVTLAIKEIKVFREDLKTQNYMVSRGSWFGDYADPTTFLGINHSQDQNNDRRYNNPVFDDLLAQSDNEPDPTKRLAILREAEALLVEQDCPVLPMFQYTEMCLFDPHKLTGISPHPRQEQNLYLVDIFKDGKGTDKPKSMHK